MKKLSVSLLAAVVLLLGVGCVPKIHISIGDSETSISEPSNTEKGSLSDEENNFVADNSNSSSEQETEETARNPSWMTQDQADRLAEAESARLKKTFMLAVAQDDLESFYWGAPSLYETVWRQLYINSNYQTDVVWIIVESDLECYSAFGQSDYADLWIMAESVYEAYESGELRESMSEEEYQQFLDTINHVTARLGVFNASKEIADTYS